VEKGNRGRRGRERLKRNTSKKGGHDDDTVFARCGRAYGDRTNAKQGKGWIKCDHCLSWFHES